MKNISACVLLLLSVFFSCHAQEPYFCTTPGTSLSYNRYDSQTGKLTQTTLLEIKSVKPWNGGRRIEYFMTLKKANGKDMFGGRTAQSVYVDADGNSHWNLAATVTGLIKNYLKRADVSSRGDISLLPATLTPGDTLPEVHCELFWGKFRLTIDVIQRQVLRKETITTPAGTFNCTVVRERKTENAPLHHWDHVSDNWYVQGIGYVRHDVYNDDMQVMYSEILWSIGDSNP